MYIYILTPRHVEVLTVAPRQQARKAIFAMPLGLLAKCQSCTSEAHPGYTMLEEVSVCACLYIYIYIYL